MDEIEFCLQIKDEIDKLQEEKKNEVMSCVGQFVLNDKIMSINKRITEYQTKCKHSKIVDGKCAFCRKQIEQ